MFVNLKRIDATGIRDYASLQRVSAALPLFVDCMSFELQGLPLATTPG